MGNFLAITAETVIDKIEDSYAELTRLIENLPEAQLTAPDLPNGWSVKDVVAHISAWEWRCASLLDEAHDSDLPLQAEPDVDALNKEAYEDRKNWSWEEVDFDSRAAHRSLLAAIRQMPPRRLQNDVVARSIAIETWGHYEEHLQDLRRWRARL